MIQIKCSLNYPLLVELNKILNKLSTLPVTINKIKNYLYIYRGILLYSDNFKHSN